MIETVVPVEISCGSIQLAMTHENLVQRRVALVAQDEVETAPEIQFLIKFANLPPSCTTLPIGIIVSISIPSPQSRFGYRPTAKKPDTVNAERIFKASQSKVKTTDRYSDTKRQHANLRNKDWTKTVQFNEENKKAEPAF